MVVDHTDSVVVVRSTLEHFGSDTLEGVAVVVVERMFQRNADNRVVNLASEVVLGYT